MGGRRKNLERVSSNNDTISLQEGHGIMQVISLRGSNLIEVMDDKGEKSLALFPAKFQKSIWIKRGSYVVVDESGKEKALESGSKISCIVTRVLFHNQVRALQKSPEWPEVFKTTLVDDSNTDHQGPVEQLKEESGSDGEDGLPPLEANLNRNRPVELYSNSDTDQD